MLNTFRHTHSACVNRLLSWGLPETDDLAELLSHCEEMPPDEWRQRFGELVGLLPQEWRETQTIRQMAETLGDCLKHMEARA